MSPPYPDTDADLARGYLQGDSECYRRIAAWIRVVVDSRHWGLEYQREDIVQEVHRRLFENLQADRFRGSARLKTYIVQIAKYTCIEFLRKKIRATSITELDEGSLSVRDQTPGPEERLAARERRLQAAEAVAQLPEGCRELFQMIFQERLSYQAISQRLGIAEGTVKSRAWRCREQLASLVAKRGVREGSPEMG